MEISNTAYWVFEFIKVLVGYLLVGFVWPRFVFAGHLGGKPVLYRFAFCVTVQTVLVNTVVLGLGLLHILNAWTVRIVFYGVPLVMLYRRLGVTGEQVDRLLQVLPVARGKMLFRQLRRRAADRLRRRTEILRSHWLECLALGAIVVYALIYFSWGAFQVESYGFGDQYAHHSWIYGLMQGQIFSGGVYPEAMHCMLYAVHTLLGVRVYSLVLFFGGIQGVIFLIAVYCFCREIFGCRYTPVFVLALFTLFVADSEVMARGMARLQCTLPLEFGLAPQFLCVTYLIRYLREERKPCETGRFAGYILGTDLFLFAMSLAAIIASHFYPVIMAFFMCLGVAALYFRRVFSRQRLLPLVAAALCALLVAVTPMLGALASGIPFQGSMDWAMSVINGTDGESRGESHEFEELDNLPEGASPVEWLGLAARITGRVLHQEFLKMSGEKLGDISAVMIAAVLLSVWLARLMAGRRGWSIANWSRRRGVSPRWLDGYCLLAIMALFLSAMYIAPYFGLPELISGVRMVSTIRVMLLAVLLVPLDFLLIFLAGRLNAARVQAVSALCLAAVCVWCCIGENYHEYLFYELTRYPCEVGTLNQIISRYPEDTYTVVSPTDGLYHVIEYGRHEELLDFVRGIAGEEGERYFLPTEHVFVFVEKNPIQYAQTYFPSGPAWLGTGEGTGISASEVSREAAEQETPSLTPLFENYKDLESRTIIESKAYYWCQSFMKLYPREMSVIYEDDDFVCYYFHQETNSPYDLTIAYEVG